MTPKSCEFQYCCYYVEVHAGQNGRDKNTLSYGHIKMAAVDETYVKMQRSANSFMKEKKQWSEIAKHKKTVNKQILKCRYKTIWI